MKIHNFRLGFACNSSSTHSILFLKNGNKEEDVIFDFDWGKHYGWERFICSSDNEKRNYFAAQLYMTLLRSVGNEIAKLVVADLLGPNYSDHKTAIAGIDGQSHLNFPMKFNRKEIHYDFLKEARDHLLQKDCIVVGGNDNDDVGIGFNNEDVIHSPLMDLRDSGPFIARKDEFGSWLLFNYKTGAKLRFSFDPNIVVTKSSSPELVDIKITNKCSKGCSFCYQGSCVEGKHASLDDVTMISDMLRDSQIPEVAIGGGEPTEHPDFAQILHRFGYNKIVPNFTTATLNWVKDKFILKSVKENVGAFAFSVQNEKQIDELEKVIDKYDFSIDVFGDNPNVTAQVVLGTIDMDTFKAIVEKCRKKYIHLTVLGFKETERGKTFEKKPYENWIKIVKESDIYRMGVDTCIIAEFGEQLKEISSCFEYTSTPEEGAFSTYIDAVELKMGKSSYSNNYVSLLDDDKELRYSYLINKFAKQYKKFQSDI